MWQLSRRDEVFLEEVDVRLYIFCGIINLYAKSFDILNLLITLLFSPLILAVAFLKQLIEDIHLYYKYPSVRHVYNVSFKFRNFIKIYEYYHEAYSKQRLLAPTANIFSYKFSVVYSYLKNIIYFISTGRPI